MMRTFLKQVGLVIMVLAVLLAGLSAFAWSSDSGSASVALDATLFSISISAVLGGGVIYLLGAIAEDVEVIRRRGEDKH